MVFSLASAASVVVCAILDSTSGLEPLTSEYIRFSSLFAAGNVLQKASYARDPLLQKSLNVAFNMFATRGVTL